MTEKEFQKYKGKHVNMDGIECEVVGYSAETEKDPFIIVDLGSDLGWNCLSKSDIVAKLSKGYYYSHKNNVH